MAPSRLLRILGIRPAPQSLFSGTSRKQSTRVPPLMSRAVVRGTVAGCFGCLRARKRNPVVGRDPRIVRTRRPFENVAPGVSHHRPARGLAAYAAPIRVKKQLRAGAVPEVLRLFRVRLAPEP